MEEPEFGPGLPIKTVYISGVLGPEHGDLQGLLRLMIVIFIRFVGSLGNIEDLCLLGGCFMG